MRDVVNHHHTARGTSHGMLALIRNAGIEPHVIEHLKSPSIHATLESLIVRFRAKQRDQCWKICLTAHLDDEAITVRRFRSSPLHSPGMIGALVAPVPEVAGPAATQ
jgi:hypothetical protein